MIGLTVLVALLVCLIPTTIGGLLRAIGIAGMDRMIQANVVATSGRAIEAAGDVDVLLLDKTGTITLGNRQAAKFYPAPGVAEKDLADAAQLASLADETPEGRSIVVLAKSYGIRARDLNELSARFIPFSAQTRMSGIDIGERQIRKGAPDAIDAWLKAHGKPLDRQIRAFVDQVATKGATPLVVAEGDRPLGVVELRDIVKGGIKERFAQLRRMGIKTVMITGDNRLTAAAIAAESGVDDFLAEATPEAKLKLIRKQQTQGRLVAMCGDGTNDAPALAQADVAVAMNSGTQAAKEAGNMVDLDSNPTKLIEVVEIGKQMLITRGSLTTFSIANDVAKYFAIIPAAFAATYPQLNALNVMGLASPASAILSAVIFNALIIVALIPLALRGVKTRADSAPVLLRRNLLIYGIGGLIVPFIGIKAVDLLLVAARLLRGSYATRFHECRDHVAAADRGHRRRVSGRRHRRCAARDARPGAGQPHPARRQGSRIDTDRPAAVRSEVFLEPAVGHFATAVQRARLEWLQSGPDQSGADRRRQGAHRSPEGRRPGQHGAGAAGPGDGFGQRARSAYQSGRG